MKLVCTFLLMFFALTYSSGQSNSSALERLKKTSSPAGIPNPIGWTSDYKGIYTDTERKYLDSIISNYEKETTIEIAILTIDSTMTSKENFDNYALQVFKAWGVGKKETNNGILILVAPEYRRIRISNGYGIEKVLSDEETKQILDNYILPKFKEGRFFDGTLQGLNALMTTLKTKFGKVK